MKGNEDGHHHHPKGLMRGLDEFGTSTADPIPMGLRRPVAQRQPATTSTTSRSVEP
jgi:hypothetical protein